ncbi:MAG: helix-turn-helix domain-containing protein [Candidatus Omnitrophica bacterium]|nr:helix-turn-helix domain-containing protein [Candidatus Omnitrophota bacterium]
MKEATTDTSSFSEAEERGWYSISEAAQYLGISQPTLFRWMKDGMLSFYKVGRSTRFSREGLDSLVEKTTGQKEAEAATGKCLSCGHGLLVEGRLQGNSRLYFRPDKTKFWTLHEAMVPVQAKVCTACGHVQMQVEPDKVNRLRPNEDDSPELSDES